MEEELLRLVARYRIATGCDQGRTNWEAVWENAQVLKEAGTTLDQCKTKYLSINFHGENTRFLK